MLNATNLLNGQEQHEVFSSNISKKTLVQYDYRHNDGELFSCVKPTLDDCKIARDEWAIAKGGRVI